MFYLVNLKEQNLDPCLPLLERMPGPGTWEEAVKQKKRKVVKDGKAAITQDQCDGYRGPLRWDVTVVERDWAQFQTQWARGDLKFSVAISNCPINGVISYDSEALLWTKKNSCLKFSQQVHVYFLQIIT